jgi:quercetin dioxygenase-like cupin family protein
VGEIFQINENEVPWAEYAEAGGERAQIRYKALTLDAAGVPPVQYVEYAPGHTDPVHRHKTGEFLVVTDGELWLDDTANGPGSIVFVPRDTDYAVRGGAEGVRFFRVVVP